MQSQQPFIIEPAATRPSVFLSSIPPKPILNKDPHNKSLFCGLPGCNEECRNYVKYDEHLESHQCEDCGLYCLHPVEHVCLKKNQKGGHVDHGGAEIDTTVFKEEKRAHFGTGKSFYHYFKTDFVEISKAFASIEIAVMKLLNQLLKLHGTVMIDMCAVVYLERDDPIGDGVFSVIYDTMYFRSKLHKLLAEEELDKTVTACVDEINSLKTKYTEVSSQWRIIRVDAWEVKVGEFRLLHSSRPGSFLKLPFKIKRRYAIRNLPNTDNRCFEYTISMAMFWEEQKRKNEELRKNRKRGKNLLKPATWLPYFKRLNFTGVKDGVDIFNNLSLFEANNNISVSVTTHCGEDVIPLRMSTHPNDEKTKIIHLFLIKGEREPETDFLPTHFAWIYDFPKFNAKMNPKHRGFHCNLCLTRFASKETLAKHSKECGKEESKIEYEFPPLGQKIKFSNHAMTMEFPYLAFFDFETYVKPTDKQTKGKTKYLSEYEAASYSLVIVEAVGDELRLVEDGIEYYQGENVMEHFLSRVLWWSEKMLYHIRATNNAVDISPEQLLEHELKTQCDFCKRSFDPSAGTDQEDDFNDIDQELSFEEIERMMAESMNVEGKNTKLDEAAQNNGKHPRRIYKTLHHHHQKTGNNYLQTLCTVCNLSIRSQSEMVFMAHNFVGFDSHLIIKSLNSPLIDAKDVKVVAKNGEKVVSLSIAAKDRYVPAPFNPPADIANNDKWMCGQRRVRARFTDTANFLSGSLATLVDNLSAEKHSYFSLIEEAYLFLFQNKINPSALNTNWLNQKVPFPYSFLTGAEVLDPGKPFPGREQFYDNLRDKEITDAEWDVVNTVREKFQLDTFRSYLRLYNCLDSLHLAIVFCAFRSQCIKYYTLDPAYVNTVASYSWSAFLFVTEAEIDYIRDKKMIDMISGAVKGGMSGSVGKIHSSNRESSKSYDPNVEPSILASFDVVSLYSYCMENFPFPVSSYEWVNADEVAGIDWQNIDLINSDTGYIVCVSLEYPEYLQDFTSDLPLCPQKVRVEYESLSETQQESVKRLGAKGKSYLSIAKLLSTCYNKDKYVCHGIALQLYIRMGMKPVKFHSSIKFKQRDYFRKYIAVNTARRQATSVETLRALLKMLSNVIFGRSLQTNKSFLECLFATTKAAARKLMADPNLKQWKILGENLTMFLMKPKKVLLNNPVWSGFSILEISKAHFFSLIYTKLKYIWGDNFQICQYDTDGLIAKIRNTTEKKFYTDVVNFKDEFDLSKLSPDLELFKMFPEYPNLRKENASVSGKIKLECCDLVEVVSLGSKCYSAMNEDQFEMLKHRGINPTAGRMLTHNLYKEVALNTHKVITVKTKQIRSYDHTLYCISLDKVALRNLDLYRAYYDPEDVNKCLPFGHYLLKKIKTNSNECNVNSKCIVSIDLTNDDDVYEADVKDSDEIDDKDSDDADSDDYDDFDNKDSGEADSDDDIICLN